MIGFHPTLVAGALALGAAATSHNAQPAPPRPPALISLLPGQEELLKGVAKDEFCGCDSALTLAGCLDKRPDCHLAIHLQRLLARGIEEGASRHGLANFLSQGVLGPFCAPPVRFELPGAGRLGSPKAPMTLVEFADFRCTHCREAVPRVHAALAAFGEQVQLIYAPVALIAHPLSTAPAEAVLAAGAQNKFWPMHAALFAREAADFEPQVIEDIAKKVGLQMARFRADMRSHKYAKTIERFKEAAEAAGVTGTPAFFLNGRPFTPLPGIFDFAERFALETVREQPACR